jgi:hypothetical protein
VYAHFLSKYALGFAVSYLTMLMFQRVLDTWLYELKASELLGRPISLVLG